MDEFEKAYTKTLKFLSYRPRSEKEVSDYLIKQKTAKEITEKVITTIKQQKLLDDQKFTKWWIEQRKSFKSQSTRLIKIELKQKGIGENLITAALQESTLELESELDTATKLVRKKITRYISLPRQEIYQKLGSFLARKGFDWETAKQAIDDILKKGV